MLIWLGITVIIILGHCVFLVFEMNDGHKAMHEQFIYTGVLSEISALGDLAEWTLPWWVQGMIILDLPIMACADTVLLPYTIYRTAVEPRKIAVWFISKEDGGPGFNIDSDRLIEQRHLATLLEVCTVLQHITGQAHSVETILIANNFVSLEDFGVLYETIIANQTLKLFYRPNAIEKDFLTQYLKDKKPSHNVG